LLYTRKYDVPVSFSRLVLFHEQYSGANAEDETFVRHVSRCKRSEMHDDSKNNTTFFPVGLISSPNGCRRLHIMYYYFRIAIHFPSVLKTKLQQRKCRKNLKANTVEKIQQAQFFPLVFQISKKIEENYAYF
jgi:hypothetical protein